MRPLIDYSSAGEPLIFSRFLPKSAPRVLVDVDAGDSMTGSLSRELVDGGWQAVLIERDPQRFGELKENTAGLANVQVQNDIGSNGLANVGLLLLNDASTAVATLEALDLDRFCPRLIVTSDGTAASERRGKKYDLLSSYGYAYSGLAGAYSIWQLGSGGVPNVRKGSLRSLPVMSHECRGQAAIDPMPSDFEMAGTSGEREVMISGWAFAEPTARVPPMVWIEICDQAGGRTEYVQAHRYWRPEVGARFKRRQLGMSGFRALVSLSGRPPKSATLRVVQADNYTLFRSDTELVVKAELQPYEQVAREGVARKFLSGCGIEIGALQRALPMPRGCSVRYVDRISLEELRSHYPELEQFALQAPDILDDGETLARIASNSQDFVIANHFFEHSENPIRTLRNLLRAIKPGGILYLGVPDKRYTFDFYRPVTGYEVLKETYETKARPDRVWLFEEWVTLAERRTGADAGSRKAELLATNYSIHYNVWSLDDLLGFLIKTRSDFELPFQVVSAVCCDNEAIILLERT